MFNSITKPSATGCLKVGKKGARLAERLYGLCLQPALEEREMKQPPVASLRLLSPLRPASASSRSVTEGCAPSASLSLQ
ncbi:unnamed protein product [Arctogadus glacialis]